MDILECLGVQLEDIGDLVRCLSSIKRTETRSSMIGLCGCGLEMVRTNVLIKGISRIF